MDQADQQKAYQTAKKVFLAHPKDCDGELPGITVQVQAAIEKLPRPAGVRVILYSGRDDYDACFKALGSWDAWTTNVATGVHPTTRRPNYDVIVVAPQAVIGRATKDIVEKALKAGKPVLLFTRGKLARVRGVETRAGDADFKAGWAVLV